MSKRVKRTRCGGTLTDAAFRSMIKSTLRKQSMMWAPINQCKRDARVERGMYLCAACRKVVPNSVQGKGKRITYISVDHIDPVIDPAVGFVSWDEVIARMFVEVEGLQLLCKPCHDIKTNAEKEIATKRKRQTQG